MKPVTIIGGGLAGLSLGVGLREHQVPVTLFESGRYPRHKVCGEFLSGRGPQILRDMGVLKEVAPENQCWAHTVKFFAGHCESSTMRLPEPALCLSRFHLDHVLAKAFEQAGGDLIQNHRWHESMAKEGLIRATGRKLSTRQGAWQWFGLKFHVKSMPLEADLEMHFAQSGYVGLCRVDSESTNVCGLFRKRTSSKAARISTPSGHPNRMLDFIDPDGRLGRKLEKAEVIPGSKRSVAGLNWDDEVEDLECGVGDSSSMIPPFTGNGMSMALESSQQALGSVLAYSRGDWTWEQTKREIASTHVRHFGSRLKTAGFLHKMMFTPWLMRRLIPWLSHCQPVWQSLFLRTRR